jgi:hypothetical protein
MALFGDGLVKRLEKDGKVKVQQATIDKLVQSLRS